MKISSLLLFLILILSACIGQSNTIDQSNVSIPILGDTVTEVSDDIWYMFQAKNGNYWFGSNSNGVYRYNGKNLIHYSLQQGLTANGVRGIQEDHHSNIYISTMGGIYKFDGQSFVILKPIVAKSNEEYWRLDSSDLWFSVLGVNGMNGPLRYDGKNLYQLILPKSNLENDYFKNNPNRPWNPYDVYSIYKDSKGTIWFGTSNFGVCRYDGTSFKWLYEDQLTNTPEGGSFGIRSVIEDKDGKIWICNTQQKFILKTDSLKDSPSVVYEKERGISGIRSLSGSNRVYFQSAVLDDEGNMWLATYNEGVYKFDGKNFTHYKVSVGEEMSLVFSIYKDKKGDLWLGSHNHGVLKFNGVRFEKFKF
jgi:ligand-binding sensor domain-containing protein